jgi:hypothetical protein
MFSLPARALMLRARLERDACAEAGLAVDDPYGFAARGNGAAAQFGGGVERQSIGDGVGAGVGASHLGVVVRGLYELGMRGPCHLGAGAHLARQVGGAVGVGVAQELVAARAQGCGDAAASGGGRARDRTNIPAGGFVEAVKAQYACVIHFIGVAARRFSKYRTDVSFYALTRRSICYGAAAHYTTDESVYVLAINGVAVRTTPHSEALLFGEGHQAAALFVEAGL